MFIACFSARFLRFLDRSRASGDVRCRTLYSLKRRNGVKDKPQISRQASSLSLVPTRARVSLVSGQLRATARPQFAAGLAVGGGPSIRKCA
ncbi:unnamed protein product [Penicillium roqueforti FM164]|uniref:Str. FM013 n=2 Tax=Penicillium TaxID=5073 RepID=A0A0G4PXW3_PENC3|nr:unnamed protein product [Penicillium roqueforti FM164]CRL31011.1 unnamed protein product [Penicillium camemberti]